MLRLKNISKTYSTKDGVTHRALNNISLDFEEKGLVFILGKSGSGKSTLLNIIGGLDSFDRGEIYLYKKEFSKFKAFDYDFYRNTFTGFIFQEFNLINELTIEENVALSLDLQSTKDKERVNKIFEDVEIDGLKSRYPFELSGGQKQRVAIARALVKNPSIILADEPTGSLDTNTTQEIINLLVKLSKERLVIVITHNRELAEKYGDRVIELKDGEVLKDLSLESNDEEEHASLIASSILKIPPHAKIRKEDIDKLNTVLSNEKIDHYISFETNQNKVKSMFPHLKEAITTTNEEKEKFKQYTYKEENDKEVKLIKSRLPFKRGLKFGLSNLKIKIPKLVFTLLLATLAITISGAVDNFANFDEYKALTNSIKKNDLKYVRVESSYASFDYFSTYYLKDNEIDKINELNNKEAPLIYEDSLSINYCSLDQVYVPTNALNGFIEVENIEDLGYEYLIKSDTDYKEKGIIISELIAREIRIKKGYIDYSMVIDDTINLEDVDFTIQGIYKCNGLDKYDILRNSYLSLEDLYYEYLDLYEKELSYALVRKGTVDYYKNSIKNSNKFYVNVNNNDLFNESFLDITLKENQEVVTLSSSEGVYLPKHTLESYMYMYGFSDLESVVNYLNSNKITISIHLATSNGIRFISDKYVVKGYFDDIYSASILLEEDFFNFIRENSINATGALIDVNKMSKNEVYKLVNEIYASGFVVDETFEDAYFSLVEVFILLEGLLSGINTVIFILAIILLFSFMLGSIKNNMKQIGILRAIGANIIDIIKIYVIEALIIGCISLMLSLFIYGVGGVLINNSIDGYLSIFTFGFSTVFKMISSTLLVVGASLIIPIIKICRMHPVDAIRDDK